jgi:hypothetical protein
LPGCDFPGFAFEDGVPWDEVFGAAGGFSSYVWACNGQQTAKTSKERYPIFRYAGLRLNESPETSSQIKKALERLMIKPVAAGLPRYGPMLNHASACEGNEKKSMPWVHTE